MGSKIIVKILIVGLTTVLSLIAITENDFEKGTLIGISNNASVII